MDIEKLRAIPMDELIDIRDVRINEKLSKEERIADYIKQIKNPYCYKYDKYRVITVFNEDENSKTLEEHLIQYIKDL